VLVDSLKVDDWSLKLLSPFGGKRKASNLKLQASGKVQASRLKTRACGLVLLDSPKVDDWSLKRLSPFEGKRKASNLKLQAPGKLQAPRLKTRACGLVLVDSLPPPRWRALARRGKVDDWSLKLLSPFGGGWCPPMPRRCPVRESSGSSLARSLIELPCS